MRAAVRPCGERAVLVELESLHAVLALHRAVRHQQVAGLADAVPAALTLLLIAEEPGGLDELVRQVRRIAEETPEPAAEAGGESVGAGGESGATTGGESGATGGGESGATGGVESVATTGGESVVTGVESVAMIGAESVVTIPVRYDGPDLAEVARLTGLSVEQVVAAHTGSVWTVGFGGFAPGFAYLIDGDPRLEVPRRAEPRERVPAGAVALAGAFSGVYPRESPGGWQLIGSTEVTLWDADRDPPALLTPGSRVRFVAEPR